MMAEPSNVVVLDGANVRMLEDLLSRARRGEIDCIAVAAVLTNGDTLEGVSEQHGRLTAAKLLGTLRMVEEMVVRRIEF